MTQYNILNVKLSNSQFDKLKSLKSRIKKVLSIFETFNDENNFLHNSLLPNTQVSRLRKAFAIDNQLI